MADTIIITKLINGNISIVDTGRQYPNYNLPQSYKAIKGSDNVRVVDPISGTQGDIFKVVDVEKVIRDDGTEVVISDVDTLYTELETYFFFEVIGNNGTPVPTIKLKTINQGDWVAGGTSGYYFDIPHLLKSKDLLHDVYDITGGLYDGYELNEYLPQSTSVYRVESTVNTIDVVVVLSTGGAATVITALNTSDTISGNVSPQGVGGKLIKVNSMSDTDITIDTGFLSAGEIVVFANKTAFAMNFIIGTQDVKASGSNSFVGFGQYSLVTFVNDGTDVILSGDTA